MIKDKGLQEVLMKRRLMFSKESKKEQRNLVMGMGFCTLSIVFFFGGFSIPYKIISVFLFIVGVYICYKSNFRYYFVKALKSSLREVGGYPYEINWCRRRSFKGRPKDKR